LSRVNPRRSAWEFLRDLERDGGYLNIEIANLHERLDPQDRAFATELLFGSVRMRLLLDDIIDRMSSRPIDEETRSVLRLGIYEALFMTTADHAVVNEYVEIAKMVIGKARAGFINALLRRAVREREELSDVSTLPIEIKTSHPSWIVDAYRSLMGSAELEAELDSHNQAAKVQVVSFEPLPEEIATRSPLTSFGYRLNTTPREIEAIRRGGLSFKTKVRRSSASWRWPRIQSERCSGWTSVPVQEGSFRSSLISLLPINCRETSCIRTGSS